MGLWDKKFRVEIYSSYSETWLVAEKNKSLPEAQDFMRKILERNKETRIRIRKGNIFRQLKRHGRKLKS